MAAHIGSADQVAVWLGLHIRLLPCALVDIVALLQLIASSSFVVGNVVVLVVMWPYDSHVASVDTCSCCDSAVGCPRSACYAMLGRTVPFPTLFLGRDSCHVTPHHPSWGLAGRLRLWMGCTGCVGTDLAYMAEVLLNEV